MNRREFVKALPCGCRRGFFLCGEARALWAAVQVAYCGVAYRRGDNSERDKALEAYKVHLGADKEPIAIAAMTLSLPGIDSCP